MRYERITVLVSPEEKADLASRAQSMGLPLSEYVRQACQTFKGSPDEATHNLVIDQLQRSVREAHNSVRTALAAVAETRAQLAAAKDSR